MPTPKDTYVIGDIHGCIDEMIDLVVEVYHQHGAKYGDKAPLRIVFIGDLIDKGPSSIEVIENALMLINSSPNPDDEVIWLMGNHEEKFYRWSVHEESRKWSNFNYENPIFRKEEWNLPMEAWVTENRDFLSSLPMWYKIPNTNYICVHGGFAPAMKELPPAHRIDERGVPASRFARSMLFTRFVDPKGYFVALGKETSEDEWWAKVYNGRFGKAIYGHQAYEEVQFFEHAIGIDTGCVYGNKLTALRVSDEFLIQVESRRKYAVAYASEALEKEITSNE